MTRLYRVAAIAAVGVALLSTSARAVTLATDGIGEVAVAPYYTTRDGWQSLVSLINTQEAPVAVRMRLRESLNGRRALDLFPSRPDLSLSSTAEHAYARNLQAP